MRRTLTSLCVLIATALALSVTVPMHSPQAEALPKGAARVETPVGVEAELKDISMDSIREYFAERGFDLPLEQPASAGSRLSPTLQPLVERNLNELQEVDPNQYQRVPNWKPDDPWTKDEVEEMPVPDSNTVREAIRKAVEYVLEQQRDQGQWDVELDGTLLGATADQAVDAVAATSLAGLALRPHQSFAPKEIDEALKKGVRFIMNSIFRGKLSTRIFYAIWRYTLGLRFICQEYRLLGDEDIEMKEEMRACVYRMVNSVLSMQFSADGGSSLAEARRARVRGGKGATARPTITGFILKAPTDEDYRGGALVTGIVPGSGAEVGEFQVGDRLIELEGVRIENAVDWYNLESGFVETQRIKIAYIRPSEDKEAKKTSFVSLPALWPASLGVFGEKTSKGMHVMQVMIGSPLEKEVKAKFIARRPGQESYAGDTIYEVDGEDVFSEEDIAKVLTESKVGDKVKVKFLDADGKKQDCRVETFSMPNGIISGLPINEEDKEVGEGVLVDYIDPRYPAYHDGFREGDRITHVDGMPILSFDHYDAFMSTLWAGRVIKMSMRRDGEDMELEVALKPTYVAGDLQIQLDTEEAQPVVADITRRGASDKKLRRGDIIRTLTFEFYGQEFTEKTPTKEAVLGIVNQLPAGMTITVEVLRGTNLVPFEITLGEKSSDPNVFEEGGWNYYMNLGHAMSFVTGYVMIALMEADELFDIGVPDDVLRSAYKQLDNSRKEDSESGEDGYIYRAGTGADIRGHMGRIVLCELALTRYGRRRSSDIKQALELWVDHREELDKVRTFEVARTGPHYYPLYANAAYYWMYGHYWAMEGAHELGGSQLEEINEIVLKVLMANRRENDLWLGHKAFGTLCGTMQALMIFGKLEGDFRAGGAKIEDDDKYDKEGDEDN